MLKRTIPLLITAVTGFVLIIAAFVPAWVESGEVAAVWFDILAAIAFVLGGGNLLMQNLRKISDRVRGWGYSVVTLVAFLVTLYVGLFKIGTPPEANQEYYGEVFAELPLEAFPESQVAAVSGEVPQHAEDDELPASVRQQLRAEDGRIIFRGWMQPNQKQDLLDYDERLEWQCLVTRLAEEAQPPEPLQEIVFYRVDHDALAVEGVMSEEVRDALLEMSDDPRWQAAVNSLYERSRGTVSVPVTTLPTDFEIPESLEEVVEYDTATNRLTFHGPMSPDQRDALADQFPRVKPFSDAERRDLRQEIESRGEPLTEDQADALRDVLAGVWTVEQFAAAINLAGVAKAEEKSPCEMLAEMEANGGMAVNPQKSIGEDVTLNADQLAVLEEFAESDDTDAAALVERLDAAGELTDAQKAAVTAFLDAAPTVGQLRKSLFVALSRTGTLTREQKEFLTDDIRRETAWRATVADLFYAAHQVKYEWSGDYAAQGSPFWWIYEFLFKPLTATMFALLAFYIASAAFRAFRAKNLEAILLLSTAFIILLGRTYAGVWLTQWIPEDSPWSILRIENMSVFIGQVFNTAGMRAIMIGIALGVVSTSLKVLLGVDRSYLGSSED